MGENRNRAMKNPCVVTPWAILPPIRGTIMQVRMSRGSIQLAETQKILVLKLSSLVAQRIVDSMPRMPFSINILKPSPSCITPSKSMLDAKHVVLPREWFGFGPVAATFYTIDAIEVCKTPQSKKGILVWHYAVKQLDERQEEKCWLDIV